MFKKIVLSVVILVIVALVVAYFGRNMLVEKAVETGSAYALGVETDLGSASLEISGGSLELNNLEISNPEGFTAENFLSLRKGMVDVVAGSVLDDEVMVDSFIIEGITLNLEQIDKKGNYQVLLDHIKQLDMSSSGESQKFRIGLIALRDINVTGSLSLLGQKTEKSFKLDNFSLHDVGSDNGAKISEVTATVVKTLITKALAAGSGLFPEGFGKNLTDLKDQGMEKIKTEATDKLEDLGKSLTGDKK
ncbi:MAG: hypothetical protein CVT49_00790 [candidate division Zixibacteria bacterium HGW-Zixibacteria-1]|nr:MAG: hypothetical protein CVT49_00790 [candidate division Zixibacteria bacterium HGW-Zixibacteria-1]